MKLLRRVLTGFCAAVGLFALLVALTPFVSWYGRRLAGPWRDPKGETLIVLGGGAFDRGFPASDTVQRTLYALMAYREGGFRRVVVVGFEVGEHMRRLMIAEGMPAEVIEVEGASHSTHENAVNTARLLAGVPGTKVLLTSDYHMFRAARAFRKAGLEILPRPIPDATQRATRLQWRWPAFLDEAIETCKIVYYRSQGWI